jgi:hypothetical protein
MEDDDNEDSLNEENIEFIENHLAEMKDKLYQINTIYLNIKKEDFDGEQILEEEIGFNIK